jgi:hypothetical protein
MRTSVLYEGKKMKKAGSKLDWNKMLGFEQITDIRQASNSEQLGPKVGVKTGIKLGTKVGNKIGLKQGLKIGTKQGIKA